MFASTYSSNALRATVLLENARPRRERNGSNISLILALARDGDAVKNFPPGPYPLVTAAH